MAATTEEKSLKFSDYLRSKMLRKKGKHHQRVRSAGGPEAAILDSPSCTSSESESSPANSPFILRRRGRSLRGKAAAADVGGTDISPEEQVRVALVNLRLVACCITKLTIACSSTAAGCLFVLSQHDLFIDQLYFVDFRVVLQKLMDFSFLIK